MSKLLSFVPTAARIVLGLIYFVFGLNGFLHFMPIPPAEGTAGAFMGGLAAAPYFFPLLKATEVVGGLALLTNRFVPLASVVLAPITLNIVLFHSMAPAGMPMALAMAAAQLMIAWQYRAAFRGLLSARSAKAEAPELQPARVPVTNS